MIKIFIAVLIFFIGIIGRGVLCSSRNYIESAVEPTSICIIIGIIIVPSIERLFMWQDLSCKKFSSPIVPCYKYPIQYRV